MAIGIPTEFSSHDNSDARMNMCLEKLYDYDLVKDGKKILGSCQRRRGEKILIQGSIHLDSINEKSEILKSSGMEKGGQGG